MCRNQGPRAVSFCGTFHLPYNKVYASEHILIMNYNYNNAFLRALTF